ncbi:MAG: hypothetical protein U0736_06005 [Gemmataceae bacterium]
MRTTTPRGGAGRATTRTTRTIARAGRLAPPPVDDEDDDRPRRRRRADDDAEDEDDDRPARRPRPARRSSSGGFLATVGAGLCSQIGITVMIGLAAAGIGVGVYGFNEMRLGGQASATPQKLPLAQLIAKGHGGNVNVDLTNLIPGDNYVYRVKVSKTEKMMGRTEGKPWEAVYVPLLPDSAAQPVAGPPGIPPGMLAPPGIGRFQPVNPADIRVLLVSRKARNRSDLEALFSQGHIQGMIVNSVSSIDSDARNMLQQAYPGADFGKMVLVEAGRTPSSAAFSVAAFAGGVGLVVLAGLLGVVALVFRPR